jgi:aminoglycoside 3-N-acetyltransferase
MPVSREIGLIPETLRKRPGAVRSSHPTESFAAIGREARDVVGVQMVDDPLAPIRVLADRDGWILMLGADLTGCTPIHLAEGMAGRRLFVRWSVDQSGMVFPVRVSGCSRGFNSLERIVQPVARETSIGNARVRAYPARMFVSLVADAIRRDGEITACPLRCLRCEDAIAGGPVIDS